MKNILQRPNPLFTGDSSPALAKPVELHTLLKRGDVITAGTNLDIANADTALGLMGRQALDFTDWLPYAAACYKINPDPSVYILQPYIIITSDLPNRNAVGFPLKELVKWNRDMGKCAYQGWKGQPMFYEHQNEDHETAIGVIADVTMRKLEGFGNGNLWKVVVLAAMDRTKAPNLAARVLSDDLNMVSMGAYVEGYTCSKCGSPLGKCSHLNAKKSMDFYVDSAGDLVYRLVKGVTPFETSWVEVGAYAMARGQQVILRV